MSGYRRDSIHQQLTTTTFLYLFIKISDIVFHYVILIAIHQILLQTLSDIMMFNVQYLIFPCARTLYEIIYYLVNVIKILVFFLYHGIRTSLAYYLFRHQTDKRHFSLNHFQFELNLTWHRNIIYSSFCCV